MVTDLPGKAIGGCRCEYALKSRHTVCVRAQSLFDSQSDADSVLHRWDFRNKLFLYRSRERIDPHRRSAGCRNMAKKKTTKKEEIKAEVVVETDAKSVEEVSKKTKAKKEDSPEPEKSKE